MAADSSNQMTKILRQTSQNTMACESLLRGGKPDESGRVGKSVQHLAGEVSALGRDASSWGQANEKVMAPSNFCLPRSQALDTHPSGPHSVNRPHSKQSLLVSTLICYCAAHLQTIES